MAKNKKKTTVVRRTKKSSSARFNSRQLFLALIIVLLATMVAAVMYHPKTKKVGHDIDSFKAQPFNVVRPLSRPLAAPSVLTPAGVRNAYNLGGSGGSGTIAIIDAFDDPALQEDLAKFNTQYGLPACTKTNRCLEIHKMTTRVRSSNDWAMEIALDVEWAHAVAPNAKILLVEATSNSGSDLLNAIDYARARSDVVAISMSWGGDEFTLEGNYEDHFASSFGATFFASSGDYGHGTSWPAVSANVVSVGGTTLNLDGGGHVSSETAWNGSGGGVSSFISEPAYQKTYNVPSAGNKRATPDVSYDADPSTGFPVYNSQGCSSRLKRLNQCWYQVGGTSAGAPQWAGIRAINSNVTLARIYQDAAVSGQTKFRDITSGNNGSCGYFCNTRANYDYVTGVGSPLGTTF